MRYFLGLDLDPTIKLEIDHWRSKALPKFQCPTSVSNFHITLVFLGDVDDLILEQLSKLISTIKAVPFSLTLNQLGFWSKPRILFLGAEDVDKKMHHLVSQLTHVANQCNLHIPKRPYIPHVTLSRKMTSNPAAAIIQPSFQCHFDQIHLYESVSSYSGVQYLIRDSWSLQSEKYCK
ncbi:RNA 2',3'-cyclic phosphodiesterase [Alteromonadaceae bacterium BrNp21-10]|nr:RNA 2',3'-cyclic phosphodiesterase [Alteromonadaceae bacterium BrNp21-10]